MNKGKNEVLQATNLSWQLQTATENAGLARLGWRYCGNSVVASRCLGHQRAIARNYLPNVGLSCVEGAGVLAKITVEGRKSRLSNSRTDGVQGRNKTH